MEQVKSILQALIIAQNQLIHEYEARREAEYLLSYVLNWPISKIIAYPDYLLTHNEWEKFNDGLERRRLGEPLAYIKKNKSFWNISLEVNASVLIPRPETEILIEAIMMLNKPNLSVLDLGTGSGAIAIALAANQPNWKITATDISHAALSVAKNNAINNKLRNTQFYQGSWYDALPTASLLFDVIVSNPPYIAPDSEYLKQNAISFEPRQALVSERNGLADLEHIIQYAKKHLALNGYLFVEHGYDQEKAVQALFKEAGFEKIKTLRDIQDHARVTYAENSLSLL